MSTKTIETITSTYNRYMMKNRAEGGELAAKKAEFLFELYAEHALNFEKLEELDEDFLAYDLAHCIEENLCVLDECLSRASWRSDLSSDVAFELASNYVRKQWDGDICNITFLR